ncbi:Hypothetical predicted protein [Lecanosticta acicola]|uniref:Uncharacterized protein n=1 Tax=Lecanosticta acicola TaxID=111012 RepID=A0AAI8YZP0_9PEZI|nr:Hypothetical predicted protein [Lecanosticta acicola]
MRLGQGFNTFTQQICVDDAVIIDQTRAENVLTNDGTTMRILVQSSGKPSAWSRQKEVVANEAAIDDKPDEPKKIQPSQPKKALQEPEPTKSSGKGAKASKPTKSAKEDEPKKEGKADAVDESPNEEPLGGSDELVEADDEPSAEEHIASPKATSKSLVASRGKPAASAVTDADEALAACKGRQRSVAKEHKADEEALLKEERERLMYAREERKERERERREEEQLRRQEERERRIEERQMLKEVEKERWEEEKRRRAVEVKQREEDAAYKRQREQKRQVEADANIDDAANMRALSMEEMASMKADWDKSFEERTQRFKGMLENKKEYELDDSALGGPSQVVTYTSRFVDKLSDITEDMNISGSLSIKAGKFGGSGKGAFIDSDKFKEADLNFYISVKVINQTINFKDALVFNKLRSVNKDNFNQVFGDGFISGFQEGGEFNALVSMKILNKAKKTDIQAAAKVAFTAGTVDITAQANVNVAKTNIETNTETTIQVSWAGGGHIKPREQQWDIPSLMQAAARFPDLVANCPQRIYAIVTKYDSLRSFLEEKPAGYTKLQYENAQIYTNAMMDSYMSYKTLYTKLGSQIFDVQNKTKTIQAWKNKNAPTDAEKADGDNEPAADDDGKADESTGGVSKQGDGNSKPPLFDTGRFAATVAGLGQAKKAIRKQMALIVNEVDSIEQDPKLATDDNHYEPFQDPVSFEERLPVVESPEKPKTTLPLDGKLIVAKTQTEEEAQAESAEKAELITDRAALSMDEQSAIDKFLADRPHLGRNLQLSPPIGSETKGGAFSNLEFLQPAWKLLAVKVEIHDGAVSCLWLHYDNGLILTRGTAKGGRIVEMSGLKTGERIISASIQIGKGPENSSVHRIIALQLHTNRGRNFIGQADVCSVEDKAHLRDGTKYTDVQTRFFDVPLKYGTLKGFYGRTDDTAIWRLGLIWGDLGRDEGFDGFTENTTTTAESLDPITEAKMLTVQSQEKVKTLTAENHTLRSEKEQLNSTLQSKRNELYEEVSKLNERARQRIAEVTPAWGNRSAAFKRGRVEVHFVVYGGRIILDDAVANRILDAMERNTQFLVNDETLGGDPWHGNRKAMDVVYRYDGKGEMRCSVGKQDEYVSFDQL